VLEFLPFDSLVNRAFGKLVEQRSLMRDDVRAKCQPQACKGSWNAVLDTSVMFSRAATRVQPLDSCCWTSSAPSMTDDRPSLRERCSIVRH